MPPDYSLNNFLIVAIAFFFYYLGIYIRDKTLPAAKRLPLRKQMLLGIPVCLATLSSMMPIIQRTMTDFSVLVTIGLIIEQGMVVNETGTRLIQDEIRKVGNGST